ncbi:MAG: hypothetical protein LUG58_05630, partial [Clostridiales bacterium]|nr:hypothetical protein [Clostridiales bacterium]
MSYATDRKMENVYALRDLATLYNKPIRAKDYKHLVETQNKKIQELMQRAWEVPFYRSRFVASDTVPGDYQTAAALYKFPV